MTRYRVGISYYYGLQLQFRSDDRPGVAWIISNVASHSSQSLASKYRLSAQANLHFSVRPHPFGLPFLVRDLELVPEFLRDGMAVMLSTLRIPIPPDGLGGDDCFSRFNPLHASVGPYEDKVDIQGNELFCHWDYEAQDFIG